MGEIAAYARSIKEETPMTQRIRTALSKYIYRLHHFGFQEGFEYPQTDAPWNFIILILYMIIIFAAVSKKKSGIITVLYLAVLFIVRSLLWMYILVGERDPIRVTHGLMFAEIMLLLGIVVRTMSLEDRKLYTRGGLLLLIVLTLVYIPNTVNVSKEEARQRSIVNSSYEALYDYMDEHSQNFYWIDVYSSVSYSEKMFTYVDNGIDNYDILGGWACKSPLQVEKLDAFGYKDIQSSLLTDNSYLVISSEYSTDWLVAYYNDKGIKIVPNEVDVVGGFKIMKISEETE